MYFEQQIVDGVLCHRSTPNGEWIKYTQEELTGMLQNYHGLKSAILEVLDRAASYSYLKSTSQNLINVLFNFPY